MDLNICVGVRNMAKKPPEKRYIPIFEVKLVRDGSLVSDRKVIRTPEDAHLILQGYFANLPHEEFVALLLNVKNFVIALSSVSVGTLSASLVHPRELFQRAILGNAASIIIGHNHPSGDPTPSPEDLELTQRLLDAGKLLDIAILDHIIVGDGCFAILKEKGHI